MPSIDDIPQRVADDIQGYTLIKEADGLLLLTRIEIPEAVITAAFVKEF